MNGIQTLLAVMARLRDPERGCEWDRAQTMASIIPHTLEECYELAEAIAVAEGTASGSDSPDASAVDDDLRGELGDLLFQVVFLARIGEEAGCFCFDDVAQGIAEKLIRRHPHVFEEVGAGGDAADAGSFAGPTAAGPSSAGDAFSDRAMLHRRWEAIKAEERAAKSRSSELDEIPLAAPALSRAQKLGRRAARVGFDFPSLGAVWEKVDEERAELAALIGPRWIDPHGKDPDWNDRPPTGDQWVDAVDLQARVAEELGDWLFALVNLARHLNVDAESALRAANRKFERRFRAVERLAVQRGLELASLDVDTQDALYRAVKADEDAWRASADPGRRQRRE